MNDAKQEWLYNVIRYVILYMLSGDECKDVEPDSDSDGEEGEEGDDA